MPLRSIAIGGRRIGAGAPVFVIAEAGINHNGKLSLARKLIDAAARAGADAVKFQTFTPDLLVTKSAAKTAYQKKNERRGRESQYEMLKRLVLPRAWHRELKRSAEKKGLIFLSTPFSLSDAEFLRKLGVPALKVGSSDANNIPYLRAIARWRIPIILSTGMSDLNEVRASVSAIQKAGNAKLIVLHCTTNYPTPFAEANLRAMQTLQKELDVLVGFSDHTEGNIAAIASVTLGASVIERHLTLDKTMPGPDHKASLNPKEFGELVRAVRDAEKALGTGKKELFPSEKEIAKVARKSLVTVTAIKKGETFSQKNLTTKRPGTGLPPKDFDRVIDSRATRDIPADTLLTKKDYVA